MVRSASISTSRRISRAGRAPFLWKNGEGFECSRAFRELDSLTAFKSSDDCLDSASRRGLGSAEGSQDGDLDGRGFL